MGEDIKCFICKKVITDGKFVYEKFKGKNVEICDHHPRPKED